VLLNGTMPTSGSLPGNNDSTIARQADRSGFPRLATLTFPAMALKIGANELTFTRGAGTAAGNGLGWDTIVMEVDESARPAPAQLTGKLVSVSGPPTSRTFTLRITNTGQGPANDVRLTGWSLTPRSGPPRQPTAAEPDPNRSPVPVVATLAPGASATATLIANVPDLARFTVNIAFSANGGRVRGVITTPGGG
jgi:rhamnogalacturonan endolyase